MASCKKSSFEPIFEDRPEIRMQKSIEEVNSILTTAPNGWIATLPTQEGGGYAFYVTFDAATQGVKMYADLNDGTSTDVGNSTFRVKANAGAQLIFDTYNYISLLEDPNPASFGGVRGSGFKSDVEFIYDRSTADSIVFTGKKYRQPFKLVKATAAQSAVYTAGGYKTAIDKLKTFFASTSNPYIELLSGSTTLKIGVTVNSTNALATGKRVDFTGVLADGNTVKSSNAKFGFKLDGMSLLGEGLIFEGITFVKFAWKDATTLAVYDSAGKEYIIKSSISPLVPLFQLWGSKYNGMLSEFKTIYPGTSTKGADLLNYYHTNVTRPAIMTYSFNYGRMNFAWNIANKRLEFIGHTSQSAGVSTWATKAIYNYTVDGSGVYTFTLHQAASGGYASPIMGQMDQFLKNNKVKFDYFIDGATVYGKMSSVTDPTIEMTFILQ